MGITPLPKNSVLAVPSPKHCDFAPTNIGLPRTNSSPKRAAKTLLLQSHRHTTPEIHIFAYASHQNTVALFPPTHDSRKHLLNEASYRNTDVASTNRRLPKTNFSSKRVTKTPRHNTSYSPFYVNVLLRKSKARCRISQSSLYSYNCMYSSTAVKCHAI